MTKAIYLDMDGTIADLYSVENWLPKLRAEDSTPYEDARPLISMNQLARQLNRLQKAGYKIGIVSWGSKSGTKKYLKKVSTAKRKWITCHLKSVQFDEIHIVEYGTPKSTVVKYSDGILFDDEIGNRREWNRSDLGLAFDEKKILEILKQMR